MNLSKLARTVGLALILSVTALTAFAEPPGPQACGCGYCSRTASTKECVNFDGTVMTCGYFLAITLCQG